jgi:hypothetical protein
VFPDIKKLIGWPFDWYRDPNGVGSPNSFMLPMWELLVALPFWFVRNQSSSATNCLMATAEDPLVPGEVMAESLWTP